MSQTCCASVCVCVCLLYNDDSNRSFGTNDCKTVHGDVSVSYNRANVLKSHAHYLSVLCTCVCIYSKCIAMCVMRLCFVHSKSSFGIFLVDLNKLSFFLDP